MPSIPIARRRATPLARRLARQGGLDLAALAGSGRRGRVEKGDVEAALAGRAAPAAPTSLPPVRALDLPQGRMAYREWAPASAERLSTTLRAWLDHQGEVAAVAAELHVHPQTVRYRVARLRDLFGPALDDPAARFELALALRSPVSRLTGAGKTT